MLSVVFLSVNDFRRDVSSIFHYGTELTIFLSCLAPTHRHKIGMHPAYSPDDIHAINISF
jgi:hypothetical protein